MNDRIRESIRRKREDAFLVFTVLIASRSERRQRVNPRKLYVADHALAAAYNPVRKRGRRMCLSPLGLPWRFERGDPTVALGTLVTAAFVLNLHDRLANLASPASDDLALSLDEQRVPKRIRRKKVR